MSPVQKFDQPAVARLAVSLMAAFMLGSVLVPCGGCAGAAGPAPADSWIDDPGQVRGTLAVVGAQTFVSDEGLARVAAEADARARLAAVLHAEIEQVVADWSRETGDQRISGSLTSVIDSEVFTHQLVDAPVRGTVAQAFRRRGNTMYCLLMIPDESSDAWYEDVGAGLWEAATNDEALWDTGGPAPVDLTTVDPNAEDPPEVDLNTERQKTEQQLADARDQLAAILEKRRREQAEKLRQLRERAGAGR